MALITGCVYASQGIGATCQQPVASEGRKCGARTGLTSQCHCPCLLDLGNLSLPF